MQLLVSIPHNIYNFKVILIKLINLINDWYYVVLESVNESEIAV